MAWRPMAGVERRGVEVGRRGVELAVGGRAEQRRGQRGEPRREGEWRTGSGSASSHGSGSADDGLRRDRGAGGA